MNRSKGLIAILLMVVMLILPIGGCGSKPVKTGPEVGMKAPEISGAYLDGTSVSLKELKGKPTVIVFWQTISVPSQRQLDEVEKLAGEFEGKISFFTINLGEKPEVVNKYINNQGMSLPVLIDKPQKTWAELYRIDIMPTTYIIDKNGIIADMNKGGLTYETLKPALEKLL